jgi:serine/threonine-protein kinase
VRVAVRVDGLVVRAEALVEGALNDPFVGRVFAERYRVHRKIGEGGMATVYAAEQDQEPREIALKIMNPELSAHPAFVRRFEREAKAAAIVHHPNSVRILDYGTRGGTAFIAMELLRGDDLGKLLEQEGPLSQRRAARIMADVCDVLAVAHELGIVHRDLKPENVMVVRDAKGSERVKVLDFGIAKLLDPGGTGADSDADSTEDMPTALTRVGTSLGTPAYMSPEQCGLKLIDARSDLYTCGVLLYQLITGGVPFEGESPLHTASLHIHAPPPPPSMYAPHIDKRLEAVILKTLSKSADARPQSARELGVALRGLSLELPDRPALRSAGPATQAGLNPPPPSSSRKPAKLELAKLTFEAPPSSGFDGPRAGVFRVGMADTLNASELIARGLGVGVGSAPASEAPVSREPPSSDDDGRTLLREPSRELTEGPKGQRSIKATLPSAHHFGDQPAPTMASPAAGSVGVSVTPPGVSAAALDVGAATLQMNDVMPGKETMPLLLNRPAAQGPALHNLVATIPLAAVPIAIRQEAEAMRRRPPTMQAQPEPQPQAPPQQAPPQPPPSDGISTTVPMATIPMGARRTGRMMTGSRGLLLGFLMGVVVMAVFALVLAILRR